MALVAAVIYFLHSTPKDQKILQHVFSATYWYSLRFTNLHSMIDLQPILVFTVQHKTQRKECKDFLHSAIQYCFNVIYQRSKFLFQDAHKILHFLICFGQTLYFVLVIWKTLEEVSEKCRTIEQVCRFPRLTE